MKPRALKFPSRAALCLLLAILCRGPKLLAADPATSSGNTPGPATEPTAAAVLDTPPPLGSAPPAGQTAPNAAPAPKPEKKKGPPKVRKPKAFTFPVPIGDSASGVKIPQLGLLGNLLSQMNAAQMTRIDDKHVQMHALRIDLYHPDGKEDFHITLPNSIFNLETHIITSEEPVTVKTDDFELTGERMEFDTVARTGKLLGHVSMHVHNLKQVAAVPAATPAPSP
jgi:hypothetical protein